MKAEGLAQERHVLTGDVETPYSFGIYEKLLEDFWADVDASSLTRPSRDSSR